MCPLSLENSIEAMYNQCLILNSVYYSDRTTRSTMVDMHSVEERIANCEQLTMNEVLEVNKVVQEMLTKERNVVQVRAPVTVCILICTPANLDLWRHSRSVL